MTTYSITDLGILQGESPTPSAINESGVVAAYSTNGHSFRYANGALSKLYTPGSIVMAEARGISSSQPERIVGRISTGSDTRAVLWTDGVYADLSSLIATSYSEAWEVNDSGIVAGGTGDQAFRLDMTTQQVEMLAPPNGYGVSWCSINQSGHLAGSTAPMPGQVQLFFCDQTMQLIPTPGEVVWFEISINDADVIAASCSVPDDDAVHAFTYDVNAQVFTDIHNAAFSGGSIARGINNHGVVIGSCQDAYDSVLQAMVWTPSGGMRRLLDLVDNPSDWDLHNAEGINDAGEITGWGIHQGQARGYLLTPIKAIPHRPHHPTHSDDRNLVEFVREILVAGGGIGILLPSGDVIYPKDGPVDPDSPLQRIEAARSDAFTGLAMQVLARRISDPSTRALAEKSAVEVIRSAAASAGSVRADGDRSNWLSRIVRTIADELEG